MTKQFIKLKAILFEGLKAQTFTTYINPDSIATIVETNKEIHRYEIFQTNGKSILVEDEKLTEYIKRNQNC